MTATNYVRGTVLKCSFPYEDNPSGPGPQPHYCLFIEAVEVDGRWCHFVCYGTSRLDDDLIAKHRGAIFSVDSSLIKGSPMPGRVTHFVCSHVALIEEFWIFPGFQARLDFMHPKRRKDDKLRERMYQQYVAIEQIMVSQALIALNFYRDTGKLGLPTDSSLR